ncbi:MAG TPA: hypothetical protein VMW73_03085 [Spirochaetia bacterium]|nr:hypothetical protein [Spirochaetia bacterium]
MFRTDRISICLLIGSLLFVLPVFGQTSGTPRLIPGVTSGFGTQPTDTSPTAPDKIKESPVHAAIVASGESPIPFNPADLKSDWLKFDRNGDGKIDYAVLFDAQGEKKEEALDFNHDGMLDDFLYYSRGVLVREEIDSNFDGKVDLWVYLYRGVYIERYEQDTNFDGKPDIVRVYGEKK